MADEAVQIARVSPVHREYVPTLGPLDYPESRGFAEATARRRCRRARGGARGRARSRAASAKVTGAGFHTRERIGHRGRHRQRQPPLLPHERGELAA